MSKVAIVTDSNSGITQAVGKELGVHVIPMPFFINGKEYYEDIDLTQKDFYERLAEPDTTVSTSQPSPGNVIALWEDLLKENEEVIYIPMSSGLSQSCATAAGLAEDFDGRVHVVNNQRISVTMRQSVMDALTLKEAGYSGAQIKEALEREKFESSIYIMVPSLKYLKKGGRVTPAAALIGSVLNIKPVLQIQGEKLDAYSKSRGIKAAKKSMLQAIKNDMDGRFAEWVKEGLAVIHISYCYGEDEEVAVWKKEVEEAFPGYEITGDPLALSIICHVGPGCLAVTCSKKIVP